MHRFKTIRQTWNQKTGPIPVIYSDRSSCPASCPMHGAGCYAESGNIAIHWRRLDSNGAELSDVVRFVESLKRGQLWRYGVAGDCPKDPDYPDRIDANAWGLIIGANKRRRLNGFGYTHYDMRIPANRAVLRESIVNGFTLNASCDGLQQVDNVRAMGLPAVVALPDNYNNGKPFRTKGGNYVAICPAQLDKGTTCDSCRLCANPNRKSVIGFLAHGTRKKLVQLQD